MSRAQDPDVWEHQHYSTYLKDISKLAEEPQTFNFLHIPRKVNANADVIAKNVRINKYEYVISWNTTLQYIITLPTT